MNHESIDWRAIAARGAARARSRGLDPDDGAQEACLRVIERSTPSEYALRAGVQGAVDWCRGEERYRRLGGPLALGESARSFDDGEIKEALEAVIAATRQALERLPPAAARDWAAGAGGATRAGRLARAAVAAAIQRTTGARLLPGWGEETLRELLASEP